MSCDDLARAHIVEGFLTVSIVLIRFCSFLHLGFFHFLLSFFLSLMHFAYIKWDISPKSCIETSLILTMEKSASFWTVFSYNSNRSQLQVPDSENSHSVTPATQSAPCFHVQTPVALSGFPQAWTHHLTRSAQQSWSHLCNASTQGPSPLCCPQTWFPIHGL